MSEEVATNPAYETKNLTSFQRLLRSGSWLLGASVAAAYAIAVFLGGHLSFFHWVIAGATSTLLLWVAWKKWKVRVITELATVPTPPSKMVRFGAYFVGTFLIFLGVVVLASGDERSALGLAFFPLAILMTKIILAPTDELTETARQELERKQSEAARELALSDDSGDVLGMLFGWAIAIAVVVLLFLYAPWWAAIIIILLVLVLLK